MQPLVPLLLAALGGGAAAARVRRPPVHVPALHKAATTSLPPQGPLCLGAPQARADAIALANSELQEQLAVEREMNRSLATLAEELALLGGRVAAEESLEARASKQRLQEVGDFRRDRARQESLLDSLDKALVSISFRPLPGLALTVQPLLASLKDVPFVDAAKLSALMDPQPAQLEASLKEIIRSLRIALEAKEVVEKDKAQRFEADMLQAKAMLLDMQEDLEVQTELRNQTADALARSERSRASSKVALAANIATFNRVIDHCDAEVRHASPAEAVAAKVSAKAPTAKRGPFMLPNTTELARMVAELNRSLAFSVAGSLQEPVGNVTGSPYGPWDMEAVLDIPIADFALCSGPNMGNIYLPKALPNSTDEPPPGFIISFAHGVTGGGHRVDEENREQLFRHLVAMGFVVVAHQSGGIGEYCDSSHDQLRMISWARTSPYFHRVNFTKSILAGFSMGGQATLYNAAQEDLIKLHNVVAAIAFQPYCAYGCSVPTVPTIFFAGSRDPIAEAKHIHAIYSAATVNKIWALQSTMRHLPTDREFCKLLTPRVSTFLECMALDNSTACTAAYAANPSCRYGCNYCGCEACSSCTPCWGPSPPAWCATDCAACSTCSTCSTCSQCTQ